MSSKVDLQLIIAFVDGELSSSEREEVSTMIQSDEQWFSAYVDIKSTKEELKNVKLEVTPDELKVYKNKKRSNISFNFDLFLKPQFVSGIISACLLITIFSVYSNDTIDYSTRSIERNNNDFDPYIISVDETYNEDIFDDIKDLNKLNNLLKPSLETIKNQPSNASGYLNYTGLIFLFFGAFEDDISKNESIEIIKKHNEVLLSGVNNIFKDVTLNEIQTNPSRYFNEIMIFKYLIHSEYHLNLNKCENEKSDEKYLECSFNKRIESLLRREIVNNIFLVKENIDALDYFNKDLSKISEDIISDIYDGDGRNIILFEIDSSAYINDPAIYIYLIKREGRMDLSSDEYISIHEYTSQLNGIFYDNTLREVLLMENPKLEEFFDRSYNVKSLDNKINDFKKMLSSPKSRNFDSKKFEFSDYSIEVTKNNSKSIENYTEAFYSLFFEGLMLEHPDLADNPDLYIIADPLISNMPFGVLYNANDRDKYTLDQKFNITYANSIVEIADNIDIFQRKFDNKYLALMEDFQLNSLKYRDTSLDSLWASPEIGDFLIDFYESIDFNIVGFGNSDYESFSREILNSKGISSINNLKWSNKELEIFNSEEIFLNKNATESRFLNQNFEKTDIIHLSLHGFYDNYNPYQSAVIFQPDEFNDGFLTINEIRNKDLSNVELVFLSACDTNQGKVFKNFNLLSVQKAFKDAGAMNVISTMWPVNDEVTVKFVEIFYEILFAEDNINHVAYSLAEAKMKFIERYPEYSHPHFWAGFAVYGY